MGLNSYSSSSRKFTFVSRPIVLSLPASDTMSTSKGQTIVSCVKPCSACSALAPR